MSENERKIEVSNVGPIDQLSIRLENYGVTVLTAPNGAGKSIFLDAVQHAAAGKGKLPLRDGARRGSVDCFGAHITVAGNTRHSGEFEVLSLEGRFDLAALVDPHMQSPVAADRKRIKALVGLSGVTASRKMFDGRPEFEGLDSIVAADEFETTDPVELSGRVKRAYEAAARREEDSAKTEEGHAKGSEEIAEDLDLNAESDEEVLRAGYDAARDALRGLEQVAETREKLEKNKAHAKTQLENALAQYDGPTSAEAISSVNEFADKRDLACEAVEAAKQALQKAKDDLTEAEHELRGKKDELVRAGDHEEMVRQCNAVLDAAVVDAPTGEEMAEAQRRKEEAAEAQRIGTLVREAKDRLKNAERYRTLAKYARQRAEKYRDAAQATSDVLGEIVKSDRFRVGNFYGETRVLVDHHRGRDTPFHELSPGERWALAIDEGADRVGEGGLLVIPQEAWEPIDGFTRPKIHEHAVMRKVYVLTAEATQDTTQGRQTSVKSL